MSFVTEIKRTHYCGDVNLSLLNQNITLMGWVDTRRDHGGLIFLDVRDREGLVQVVLNPEKLVEAKKLRNEFVVALTGKVIERPDGMKNKNLKTGDIEVEALALQILSEAETPPFQPGDDKVSEVLRLKYRYLDLRSSKLQSHLVLRHKVTQLVRAELDKNGFLEIETPILYKSTPEGARDYLVPSRVNQGSFYALPQSPQTLKQLLMIGGMDKYYQVARCFRDEDLRADRQPEFSQVDIEMSFVDEEDVMALTEKIIKKVWKEIKGVELQDIPVYSYDEVMSRFGSDKPDLRIPWELKDIAEQVTGAGFKVFDDVLARGGVIKGFFVDQLVEYSRGQFDKLTALAKQMGAKGLVWIKIDSEGNVSSPVSKFFSDQKLKDICKALGAKGSGAALIVSDDFEVACNSLGFLRSQLGHSLGIIDNSVFNFLWVNNFPLLTYDAEGGRWAACHHPFTHPKDSDISIMTDRREKEYGKIKAKAYDLVCNGFELAGGSIRIHRGEMQSAMFDALGLTPEETQEKFGFFVEALKYGTPPHGGIAWGLDRLIMILAGTDAIREVIAFPKTAKATCLMSEAPNKVANDQLLELGIRLNTSVKAQENSK